MSLADLPRPPHQEDLLRQHLSRFLGVTDTAALNAVCERLRWLDLAGGEPLIRQGEAGDALFMLVSGRLRAYIDEPDGGPRRMVREIARGEVVGEMSLFTGAPRSATVVALRDSVLVALDRADFHELLPLRPDVTMALTRQVIHRLQTERGSTLIDSPVAMALVPVTAGVDSAGLAAALAAALPAGGRVAVLDRARVETLLGPGSLDSQASGGVEGARRRVAMLLDEVESTHDYVLLVGDDTASDWTGLCLRHADEILLLADADAPPQLHESERRFLLDRAGRGEAAEVLVLLHPADRPCPRGTAAWLARRPVHRHLHVRPALARDIARLARFQSRQAVGLVLAGGGARGFAHLGVLRALQERGIEIDCVGGTSIGAVMATLTATDLPFERLDRVARPAFAANPTGDFTLLPFVSLMKGRRLRRVVSEALRQVVGDGADVEDLWKPFFCVATNYSQASELVLDRGPLLQAILASIAIPGALPPVLRDGELLCDGGTFNNFPVDVMRRQRGVGQVIGVDLSADPPRRIDLDEVPDGWALLRDRLRPRKRRRFRLPSLPTLLINATILYSQSRQKQARTLTDLYFNPPLKRVGMLDWSRYDEVVRLGYEHAVALLDGRGAAPAAADAPDLGTAGGLAAQH